MRRQLQGIALILFSILLTIGFDKIGISHYFDLDKVWTVLFIGIGIWGLVWVFTKPTKDK